jgi:hypothetical protein
VLDLEKFVQRGEPDPVYCDGPYYLYPDAKSAASSALLVIPAGKGQLIPVSASRFKVRFAAESPQEGEGFDLSVLSVYRKTPGF